MTIQKKIILRYRAEGHARFELPEELCSAERAQRLIAGLRGIEGVYRVDLNRRQRKLSVRHSDTVLDFAALAHGLHAVVADLEKLGELFGAESRPIPPIHPGRWRDRLRNIRPVRWMRDKYEETRGTATGMGIVARRSIGNPPGFLKSKEHLINDFLVDVLVIYLVKVHWNLITQHWLRRPFRYRYQWLAVLYLIYLHVRSRKPKPQLIQTR